MAAPDGGEGGKGLDGGAGIAGAVTIGREPGAVEDGEGGDELGIGDEAQPASRASRVTIRVDLMGIWCLAVPQSITLKKSETGKNGLTSVNNGVNYLDGFLAKLVTQRACLVSVHATRGSVPRERGAWMAVFVDEVMGTVGGGQLEFQAIAQARRQLDEASIEQMSPREPVRYALGPNLGQCCGGEVHLVFELVHQRHVGELRSRLKAVLRPVALFGGGHVGKALVQVLVNLPFEITWVDSRDEIFPLGLPAQVRCEHSDPIQAAVAELDAGSQVLIMSFSHAEDLDVVAACLLRLRTWGDLPYIGLIGSQTKWARFRHQLEARGFSPLELNRVTCPIGVAGINSKLPEVIAVVVAAQLLLAL